MQLLLYKLNPTIKYFAYPWLQLKESRAVDSFSCLFKVLIIIVCVLLVRMFVWILLKRLVAFVGIILRIIGEFKKNCQNE